MPCSREAFFLWRVNKLDFIVWLTAFFIVVFAGVEAGLAAAVGLSLLIVLWKVRTIFHFDGSFSVRLPSCDFV